MSEIYKPPSAPSSVEQSSIYQHPEAIGSSQEKLDVEGLRTNREASAGGRVPSPEPQQESSSGDVVLERGATDDSRPGTPITTITHEIVVGATEEVLKDPFGFTAHRAA